MSDSEGCGAAFGGFILGALIAGSVIGAMVHAGWHDDVERWRREAVRHGAAEWIMDPSTGKTDWRWLDKPKDSKPASE